MKRVFAAAAENCEARKAWSVLKALEHDVPWASKRGQNAEALRLND